MELSGEYSLPAPRQQVWELLNNPKVLSACIPGCELFESSGDSEYSAVVVAKFGPVKAKFTTTIGLENLEPPSSYTLTGNGKGGVAGFASGSADVELVDNGEDTLLKYEAKLQIGGKLAQVGSRLFKGSFNKIAGNFFDNFRQIAESGEVPD